MKTGLKLMFAALLCCSAAAYSDPSQNTDYTTLKTDEWLDFRYSFPTVVGTSAALLAKIRGDQNAQYSDYMQSAREDAADRRDKDFPFHRYEFWRDWTVAGDAFPLLSLQSHVDDFTGGAHGNHYSSALLWDEKRDTEVYLDALFGGLSKLWAQIRRPYCAKLDAERRRRKADSVGCPEAKELTIVMVDSDFDSEFDTVRIIADPYVAGSYAEGTYIISLPITPQLHKMIEPRYRGSFEVHRQ